MSATWEIPRFGEVLHDRHPRSPQAGIHVLNGCPAETLGHDSRICSRTFNLDVVNSIENTSEVC